MGLKNKLADVRNEIDKKLGYSYSSEADVRKFEREQNDNTPVIVEPVMDAEMVNEVLKVASYVRRLKR